MFKIGQKVICIDASDTNGIVKGHEYTVLSIHTCSCGLKNIVVNYDKPRNKNTRCSCGQLIKETALYRCSRFKPIQENETNSFIKFKDIKIDLIEEKLDVPEKILET